MARKLYMILDTETVTPARHVFDLGYKVVDTNGDVYAEASYCVAENFTADGIAEMLADNFTSGKAVGYLADIIAGRNFELLSFAEIRDEVNAIIAELHPILCAYNIAFDLNALNKTSNKLLSCDFFEHMPELLDIWAAALSTICNTRRYVQFVVDNAILTDKGNPSTGAEAVYRFITQDPEFAEAHTARADCEIEHEILMACRHTHRRMDRNPVRMALHHPDWKRVVSLYREMMA